MQKSEHMTMRVTPEQRREWKNIATNLDLPIAELFRRSIDEYLAKEIREAQGAMLERCLPYLTQDGTDKGIYEFGAILKGMDIRRLKEWSDPEQASEETFERFIKMKIDLNERETVLTT